MMNKVDDEARELALMESREGFLAGQAESKSTITAEDSHYW
jgi:hypothetical protein